jgi:hypothetical protein
MSIFASLFALTLAASPLSADAPVHPTGLGAEGIDGCEDLSSIPVERNIDYSAVQSAWSLGGCLGCHNNAARMGSLQLDTASASIINLINQPSYRNDQVMRVVPSSPDSSLLYAMLNCAPPATYDNMPPSMAGNRIDIALRARVYDWIAEGARGADEDGNPVSDIIYLDQIESDRLQRGLIPPPPTAPLNP